MEAEDKSSMTFSGASAMRVPTRCTLNRVPGTYSWYFVYIVPAHPPVAERRQIPLLNYWVADNWYILSNQQQ